MGTIDRKQYTLEFKVEAVRLMRQSGKSVKQVARELKVSDGMLYRWEDELKKADPGTKRAVTPKDEREQLARLQSENVRLKQELDFLRQAAAYFARERK